MSIAKQREQWAQVCDDLAIAGRYSRSPQRTLHRQAAPRDHFRDRIRREWEYARRLHDEIMKAPSHETP